MGKILLKNMKQASETIELTFPEIQFILMDQNQLMNYL